MARLAFAREAIHCSLMETTLSPGLLVATPALQDPNFSRTVILLFEQGDEGAVGLVVNRILEIPLDQVLTDMKIEPEVPIHSLVQTGGPVSVEIGWVIHSPDYREESTRAVTESIFISTSREILEAIARGEGPESYMLCLGYAGWAKGQLESEIAEGAWLTLPPHAEVLFRSPLDERWRRCYELLGIDPHQLALTVGNA